jgi:hypothetical protein
MSAFYVNPHAPSCPWYDITERVGAPNLKWCEETLCQWVSEPANTWSNISYFIIASVIIFLAWKNKESFELKQFGPIVFFMGAMSFFYHQSNFYLSQVLDFIGMFFFVGWNIGMNLIRLGKIQKKNLIAFNVILAAIYTLSMHLMYLAGIKYQGIVLVSGFIIIGTEIQARKRVPISYRWFISAIATLVIAFGFSIADGQRIWCDPTQHGWFSQGHAVWHWVAAVAMLFIYLHFAQPALRKQNLG